MRSQNLSVWVSLLWSLSQLHLSVGPKYTGCLGINSTCWPWATLLRPGIASPSGASLPWPLALQNTTNKWIFLLFIINSRKHLEQHVGASVPIAGDTGLCGQTFAKILQRFLSVELRGDNVRAWHSPNLPTTQTCGLLRVAQGNWDNPTFLTKLYTAAVLSHRFSKHRINIFAKPIKLLNQMLCPYSAVLPFSSSVYMGHRCSTLCGSVTRVT